MKTILLLGLVLMAGHAYAANGCPVPKVVLPKPPPYQEYTAPPLSSNHTGYRVVAPGGGPYNEDGNPFASSEPITLKFARVLGLKKTKK